MAQKQKAEAKQPPRVAVLDAGRQELRQMELHPDVFAVRVNEHLIYEAVKEHRAGGRAGTHATKNRALVSGTGKKPWRQKGTGRARVGESRNPLWRHGGTVFGPQPRDYSWKMPRKARAAALRAALTQRLQEGAITVVEQIPVELPEERPWRLTHQLETVLSGLGLSGKTVIVDAEPSVALRLSGRNLPGVRVLAANEVGTYDVLDCRNLLVSQEGLSQLEERLTP